MQPSSAIDDFYLVYDWHAICQYEPFRQEVRGISDTHETMKTRGLLFLEGLR